MSPRPEIHESARALQGLIGALLLLLSLALAVGWWVASELGWAPGAAASLAIVGLAVLLDSRRPTE